VLAGKFLASLFDFDSCGELIFSQASQKKLVVSLLTGTNTYTKQPPPLLYIELARVSEKADKKAFTYFTFVLENC
jgi:hypothetical protein